MMPEYTTLTSYWEALVAERTELDEIDINALVEEKIASMRARITAETIKEVEDAKFVVNIKIEAITNAIDIVTRAQNAKYEVEDEVPEVISVETI